MPPPNDTVPCLSCGSEWADKSIGLCPACSKTKDKNIMPPFSLYLQRLAKYQEKLRKLELQNPDKPCKVITTNQIINNDSNPFPTYIQYLQYRITFDSLTKNINIYMSDKTDSDQKSWTFAEKIPISEVESFLAETRMFNDPQKANIRKWME